MMEAEMSVPLELEKKGDDQPTQIPEEIIPHKEVCLLPDNTIELTPHSLAETNALLLHSDVINRSSDQGPEDDKPQGEKLCAKDDDLQDSKYSNNLMNDRSFNQCNHLPKSSIELKMKSSEAQEQSYVDKPNTNFTIKQISQDEDEEILQLQQIQLTPEHAVQPNEIYDTPIHHQLPVKAESDQPQVQQPLPNLPLQNPQPLQKPSSPLSPLQKFLSPVHQLQKQPLGQSVQSEQQQWKRDKESLVMRYAQSEQKNIELQSKMTKMEQRFQEWTRDREMILGRMNVMKSDRLKMNEHLESRAVEIVSLRREIERLKEVTSSQETNIKWQQNKFKIELESHKETKTKLEEAQNMLKVSKEELYKTRRDAGNFIKKQQEVELLNSITKDLQLKEVENDLLTHKQEKNDQEEILALTKSELDSLKTQQKDLIVELSTYKDKVNCLEAERLLQEDLLNQFKDTLQKQKLENKDLADKLSGLDSINASSQQLSAELEAAVCRAEELQALNAELSSELESCAVREGQRVEDSQRRFDEIVQLQTDRLQLVNEVSTLNVENERLKTLLTAESEKSHSLENRLSCALKQTSEQTTSLQNSLEQQTHLAEELRKRCEENEEEIKTTKRRHLASSKDLMRQISQLQKRLESQEVPSNNDTSRSKYEPLKQSRLLPHQSSRTNPTTTRDRVSTPDSNAADMHPGSPDSSSSEGTIMEWDSLDKSILVEKILRLQGFIARQNEKMEFLQEHNQTLLDELVHG